MNRASASKFVLALVLLSAVVVLVQAADKITRLQVGVKHRPEECTRKSKNGERLSMHYTGKLTDGTVFDSSVTRGEPFTFTLGVGQVIKGWDKGLVGMCIGEKRRLRIPSEMAYGKSGSPPTIPPDAPLIFDVELIDIV